MSDLQIHQAPDYVIFPVADVGAGEMLNLADLDQVAAWSHALSKLWGEVKRAKEICDERLRAELAASGRTSLIVAGDELEVEEQPGRASYDGEVLFRGLVDAGLDREVVAAMFRPELRDARELGKLERRNDAVAKAAEAARTRARGRIKVSRKRAASPAPRASEVVQEAAREQTAVRDAARARGI